MLKFQVSADITALRPEVHRGLSLHPSSPMKAQDQELIEQCLETLRVLGPVEKWKVRAVPDRATQEGAPPHVDGYLDLWIGGERHEWWVETKGLVRPLQVGPIAHVAHQLKQRGRRMLLCARRIPEKVGEELRKYNVAYIDEGGNAYLEAPGLFVFVTGRPAVANTVDRGKHLTGTEVRLLGVFLREPDAGKMVQTELAERAGIALGAVGRAREKLGKLHVLRKHGPRQWFVLDRERGLQQFAEGWAANRQRLRPRKYRTIGLDADDDLERKLKTEGARLGCLLGGERALGHFTRYLRTEQVTLHVPPEKRQVAVKALKLVPDDEGPITLVNRYGTGDENTGDVLRGMRLAHPLLVWAECQLVPDERVAQAAKQLFDDCLIKDRE